MSDGRGRRHGADWLLRRVRVHTGNGNRTSETVALSCLSAAWSDLGDHVAGRRLADSALESARALGNRRFEANALFCHLGPLEAAARPTPNVEDVLAGVEVAVEPEVGREEVLVVRASQPPFGVDTLPERHDVLPLRFCIGLGDARIIVDPRHGHHKVKLRLTLVHRARDRRGAGGVRRARQWDVPLTGQQP